jgi:hypothetical protein
MRYLDKLQRVDEDGNIQRIEPSISDPELELAAKNTHDKLLVQTNMMQEPGGHNDNSILFRIAGQGQNASIELDGQDVLLLYRWLEQHQEDVAPPKPEMVSQEIPNTNRGSTQQMEEVSSTSGGSCGGGYEDEYKRLQEVDREDAEFWGQFDEPEIMTSAPPPLPGEKRKSRPPMSSAELKAKHPNPGIKKTPGFDEELTEEELRGIIEGVLEEMGMVRKEEKRSTGIKEGEMESSSLDNKPKYYDLAVKTAEKMFDGVYNVQFIKLAKNGELYTVTMHVPGGDKEYVVIDNGDPRWWDKIRKTWRRPTSDPQGVAKGTGKGVDKKLGIKE